MEYISNLNNKIYSISLQFKSLCSTQFWTRIENNEFHTAYEYIRYVCFC